jgi:hypothetical protein
MKSGMGGAGHLAKDDDKKDTSANDEGYLDP